MIDIIEIKKKYSISKDGRIVNLRTKRELKHQMCERGYNRVAIYLDRRHTVSVHRLVAMCFVDGRSESKNEVNHIDGNKDNNCPSNLQWVNHKENMSHASETGLTKSGLPKKDERNMAIRKLKQSGFSRKDIALAFEISEPRVSQIINTQ